MADSQQAMRIVIISPDKALLREMAWVLSAVGHHVETSTDTSDSALWRQFAQPDVLLVDGRAQGAEPATSLQNEHGEACYQIVLFDGATDGDLANWFAAGAHDAIRVPLSRGELVARIRQAARWLTFERRLRAQTYTSFAPGWLTESALVAELSRRVAWGTEPLEGCVLLVAQIDWFEGYQRQAGQGAARRLAHSAARSLRRVVGEKVVGAYLEQGRFALVLPATSIATARKHAEQIAEDFGCRESHRDSLTRPTMTLSLTGWQAEFEQETDQWLQNGLEGLEVALHSGGDTVQDASDCRGELQAWQQEVTVGNPFASVVAMDIMQTFPATLTRDKPDFALADSASRAGFTWIPVVDGAGKSIGVVDLPLAAGISLLPAPHPLGSIPASATFGEIYEAFAEADSSHLLVEADGQPVGYLTCEAFTSLIEPVSPASYAHSSIYHDTRDLMVPWLADQLSV